MSLPSLRSFVGAVTKTAALAWRAVRRRGSGLPLVGLTIAFAAAVHGSVTADTAPPTPTADATKVDATKTGRDADAILERLLPPRSDTPADWQPSVECLHAPGEPRALTPCVPPPPCDPSQPQQPFDLVGVPGTPSCGPIYRGPCEPRSGRHQHGVFAWYHHLCDRMFDHFYRSK